jgi:hypothetical protein
LYVGVDGYVSGSRQEMFQLQIIRRKEKEATEKGEREESPQGVSPPED